MAKTTFKSLFVSQSFVFKAKSTASPQGPWVKVGKLSYRELVNGHAHGLTYRVGSTAVEVEPVQ